MKACTTDASPAKSPSTIFLAVKGGFAPRFLLRTEIVPTLCRAGVCVVLLTPDTDEPYFVSEFKRDGVFMEPLRIEAYERYLQLHWLQWFFRLLRTFILSDQGDRDMLRRWKGHVTRDGAVAFPGKGHQTPEQGEPHRLREENRRLQMEREILKKATLSSTDQCNTIRTNIDMEGVGYGTIRASRTFDYPKRGCVATVEKRTILERYWSSPWQACGVDTPGRLFQWRDYFTPPTAFLPRPDAG